jgi:hypothetical protein
MAKPSAVQRFQQASQAAKGRTERAVGRAQQVQERSRQMTANNGGELTYVASGRRGVVPVRVGADPGIRKRANRAFNSGLTAEGFLKADSSAVFQASKGRATRMSSQRSNRGYRAPQTRLY